MTHPSRYDPLSPEYWETETRRIDVGDAVFWDDERVLTWLYINEITLEPVSNDPNETKLEPVFWVSDKDGCMSMDLSLDEILPYVVDSPIGDNK
jgi:hypothetical protein